MQCHVVDSEHGVITRAECIMHHIGHGSCYHVSSVMDHASLFRDHVIVGPMPEIMSSYINIRKTISLLHNYYNPYYTVQLLLIL